jgi:hypothetical protein
MIVASCGGSTGPSKPEIMPAVSQPHVDTGQHWRRANNRDSDQDEQPLPQSRLPASVKQAKRARSIHASFVQGVP